jgi:hypothetical protein
MTRKLPEGTLSSSLADAFGLGEVAHRPREEGPVGRADSRMPGGRKWEPPAVRILRILKEF